MSHRNSLQRFPPADLKALRWLAIAIGFVIVGLIWVAPDDSFLPLIVGFGVTLMVVPPSVVLVLRRKRRDSNPTKKRELSDTHRPGNAD
jgi:hypothetical protein